MLWGHFWYSGKQWASRQELGFPRVWALTLFGVREYTEWSSNLLRWPPWRPWRLYRWTDWRHLGPGLVWRVNGVRQVDLTRVVEVVVFLALLVPVLLITFWGTAR